MQDPLQPFLDRAPPPPAAPVRLCFAAAHVALDDGDRIDWDTTMALRRTLAGHGFAIAEAMDTAQRFQIGWEAASELIARCGALRLPHGFTAGAATDHLQQVRRLGDLVDGVVHQCRFIERHGGIPTILPMPFLCEQRATEQQYVDTYAAIFAQLDGPLFVHWLGPMFLPALQGYFPGDSFLRVMAQAPDKVRGCKLSLLDAAFELRVRRLLRPRRQIVLTGDDFHFGRLLLGGDVDGPPPAAAPAVEEWTSLGPHRTALGDFSHALLGVLDGIARPAALALRCLAAGDAAAFAQLMAPCEALGQHVFEAPTSAYKAGLAFLAWLRGEQPNPRLFGGEHRRRDAAHYRRCAELAMACGAVLPEPATLSRLRQLDP